MNFRLMFLVDITYSYELMCRLVYNERPFSCSQSGKLDEESACYLQLHHVCLSINTANERKRVLPTTTRTYRPIACVSAR